MDFRPGLQDAPDEMGAHARAADGDDADTFVGPVAKTMTQFIARPEILGMPAQHVAREVEMARDPVAHLRQVPAEAERHDVLGPADEDRAVTHPGMALDMPDRL